MNETVTTARERGGEGGKEGERREKGNSEEVFPIGVWEEGVPQPSVQTHSNDRIHHFLQQKKRYNQNQTCINNKVRSAAMAKTGPTRPALARNVV